MRFTKIIELHNQSLNDFHYWKLKCDSFGKRWKAQCRYNRDFMLTVEFWAVDENCLLVLVDC